MNTQSIPTIERRYTSGAVELRSTEGSPTKARGYAAMYGKRSANLGTDTNQFFEIIEAGAFDDVLKDDVRALFNHDANLILARSKGGAGTLSIGTDSVGLWYEFELPDTQAGRDLGVSLKRGDVDQSSFAFSITTEGQVWETKTDNGITTYNRTIKKVARLYDVSPVTYPAYPDTTVAMRSLEAVKVAEQQPITEQLQPFTQSGARAARFGLR